MDEQLKAKFLEQHIKMFLTKVKSDINRNFDNLKKSITVLFDNESKSVLNNIKIIGRETNNNFVLKEEEILSITNKSKELVLNLIDILFENTNLKLELFDGVNNKKLSHFDDELQVIFNEESIKEEIETILSNHFEQYLKQLENDQKLYERVYKYLYDSYLFRLVNLSSEQIVLKKQIIINSLKQNYEHYLLLENKDN